LNGESISDGGVAKRNDPRTRGCGVGLIAFVSDIGPISNA
jgi:hypothetical protein